jgi:cation diffusion facilitator CzcD-associated flavoprotein CzcO
LQVITHHDVLIVGAGLSGIGAAVHLQRRCPEKTYAILEARDAIGGTWDLFRYPGIRSDSDMYTLGYSFRPWKGAKAIADGASILDYVKDTAREHGVDRHIRFQHKVVRASWSSATALWTVECDRGGEPVTLTCAFLFMCSGYYDYAGGYTPDFPGVDGFKGRVVHPQKWTDDIAYAGKRVVVIGSGATAVTLVPEMAKTAASMVMLQRSPTYIVSLPAVDPVAELVRNRLPAHRAYDVVRWKNILLGMAIYNLSRKFPAQMKRFFVAQVAKELDADTARTHFTPRYNPWDQRLCLVPDADLFAAIRAGKVEVVTDEIERFTETGLALKSGRELDADLVVTATGLRLQLFGGMQLVVDGNPVVLKDTVTYKGTMLSGVPNLAMSMGYTNASWTLKADLVCESVCRLLAHMDRAGYRSVTPRVKGDVDPRPLLDFSSGYVTRSIDQMPRQAERRPWKLAQNYVLDMLMLRYGKVANRELELAR